MEESSLKALIDWHRAEERVATLKGLEKRFRETETVARNKGWGVDEYVRFLSGISDCFQSARVKIQQRQGIDGG